ncbi:DUF4012 domain-containing protein [Microbacterium nymphoidis]|uniref:DUF4012 domain-containing protein n=1 Tax=Microbacterium nymphoidis TaxID=2898586 RepID=UPI001E553DCF|nr:DUF4012 domain-containing protein [Microbacterium nymphoidis]MCD2498730.1 DUF4012 domain-containing protein [Microbacterium nymphoidis]
MISHDLKEFDIDPHAPLSRREARALSQSAQPTEKLGPFGDDTTATTRPLSSGGSGGSGGERPPARKRRRRWWPWVVFPLLIVLIAGAVFAAMFVKEAIKVRDLLEQTKEKVTAVMPLVQSGDIAQIQPIAEEVLALTKEADGIVQGQLWEFAAKVPVVGANVAAVSETTQATHILVRDALPTGLNLLAALDLKNLTLEGGGFNLQPFRDAQPKIPALAATFTEAKSHVDKIDQAAILPFVKDNIGQLVDIIDEASPAFDLAEKYLPTMLAMLGADGPRDYILLFQNNAEIRSTGGNPSNAAVLHVDNGKIEMRDDWESAAFIERGLSGTGFAPIEPAEKAQLFENDTWNNSQNFSRYPDFRDTADVVSRLWTDVSGSPVQGVISLDPVALSYMLRVTGPVTVDGEDEQITADNAVQLLLSDTYERFGADGLAASWYFGKAASAIFDKISAGGWDPLAMLDQLKAGAAEQRIYLWFPDEASQAMAHELNLDGAITGDNSQTVQTGIYLNDTSYSKLEYWLGTTMAVSCNADARTVTTSVSMTNSIPDSIGSTYTLGRRNTQWGYTSNTITLDVLGMAIPGGELVGTDPGEGDISYNDRSGVYNGRQTQSLTAAIRQGETRTFSFTSSVPADATTPLSVRWTPTTSKTPVTIEESCMSMFPGTTTPAG